MIFKTLTVPQNGSVSNFIDTEGRPIVGLYVPSQNLDGSNTANIFFQTPQFGNDPQNASAVWVAINETSPGARTDADDQGTISQELVRPFLFIPATLVDNASDAFFLVPNPYVPQYVPLDAAATASAAAATESDIQNASNQLARFNNVAYRDMRRVPNIIRLALGVQGALISQTTAARTFILALGEPEKYRTNFMDSFQPLKTRTLNIVFANGDADSQAFELFPGERLIGIYAPAAFTTVDINLQSAKPTVTGGYADPGVLTDANYVTLGDWLHSLPATGPTSPRNVLFLSQLVQAEYRAFPELPYLELPRYLRLHGSANQGAARTVTLVIAQGATI